MLRRLIPMLCLGLLCSCGSGAQRAQGHGEVLLGMGDSLSAGYGLADPDHGWVGLMEEKMRKEGFLSASQGVVNASVSGETSAGGLERLPDLLEEHQPKVVVIELGANDALRRQSMQTLSSNLTQMIQLSRKQGARVVLVGMDLPGLVGMIGGGKLEDTIEEVADQLDVPVVPFPMSDLMDDGLMQDDRLHPTAAGQPLIQDTIEPAVRKALSQP